MRRILFPVCSNNTLTCCVKSRLTATCNVTRHAWVLSIWPPMLTAFIGTDDQLVMEQFISCCLSCHTNNLLSAWLISQWVVNLNTWSPLATKSHTFSLQRGQMYKYNLQLFARHTCFTLPAWRSWLCLAKRRRCIWLLWKQQVVLCFQKYTRLIMIHFDKFQRKKAFSNSVLTALFKLKRNSLVSICYPCSCKINVHLRRKIYVCLCTLHTHTS